MNNHGFRFFLLILCLGVIHHTGGQSVIHGKVSDGQGVPVALANVMIPELSLGTYTNQNGLFEISSVPFGEWELLISHVGYHTKTAIIEVNQPSVPVTYTLELSTTRMQDVIIVADGEPMPDLIRLPVRSNVINAGEIARTPSVSIAGLLSGYSGVHVQSDFGMFSSSAVNIRGVGSGQTGTLAVLDGVPLNKSDGGSVNWNIIDKDQLAAVEVIKGPGSALFGSNAMGGVINMVSSLPRSGKSIRASASYGTYNTLEAKVSTSGMHHGGKWFWRGFARISSSDGYVNTPKEIILENDSIVVPVFYRDKSIGGSLGYRFNPMQSLEISLNYFEDIRGRGVKIYEEWGANSERDTWQASLRYRGMIGKWKSTGVVFGLREHYFRLNEYFSDGEYKLYEADSKRDDMGFRVTMERSIFKTVGLTLGAESRAGSVDAADTYYTSTDILANRGRLDIYALFAQYAFRFSNPKWQVIAGLRYDVASFYGAAFTIRYPSYSIEYFSQFQFEDVAPESWHAINPKFILEYTPGAYFRHFLSLAKGFRAPVLDDLCRTARTSSGLRAANPFLKPEHVYQLELGSDIRILKKISLELSGYHTIGDQFMHPLSNGDSVNLGYTIAPVFQVTNIARVNISGVEIDLNAPLSQRLTLRGNYTLTRAMIGSFVPFTLADQDLTGKFLANIPMHRASFEARLIVERVHLSAVMRYTGSRWIRDDNGFDNIYLMADKFKPNWVLDVKATRSFGQMKASVEAQNLMNTVYINNRGYLSPGRMIFMKLEFDLTSKNSRK